MGAHKLAILIACAALGSSCTPTEETSTSTEALFFECGNGLRYPTTEAEFRNVYAGRVFYAPGGAGRHLGYDIEYPEGTPVHAIACGRLVVYRYAEGYGTLATVVEHRLSRRVTVHNGLNEEVNIDTFLSIQGHLRPTSGRNGAGVHTGLREGMTVAPNQLLGYVEHRDLNGHGREHDHFGIRLQSYADALRIHPSSPFRGYDVSGDGRRYFADPAIFMRELMEAHPVLWHPPGTLLVNREDREERWLVGAGDTIHPVNETNFTRERLWGREVEASPAELDCYHRGSALPYETWLSTLIRFDDSPAVYEWGGYRLSRDRYSFISHEAFVSWGWNDSRVEWWSSDSRDAFFARTVDRGFRRMRDGTLVKARGHPEVSVVSEGRRLPFFNWETFIAMGYDPAEIVEIDPSVIDDVAYPRGGMITPELARLCRVPSCSGSRCDGAGPSGGGGVELPPDDAGIPAPPPTPDAGAPLSSECSADRDCPGYGSGWRCRSGSCLETDIDGDGYLGSDGDCHIDVPRIHRGAVETCDGVDEDCDGVVDEEFDLSSDPRHCGSCGRACGSGATCMSGVCTATCVPSTETCDGRDQDCDGRIDEGVSPVACSTACGSGTRACAGGSLGTCSAPVPSPETCDGRDNDCDGTVDDGVCAPACVPTSPSRDICDGRDNDCDGTVDNGCPAMSPYLVEIWMHPDLLDDCPDPGGFRINLWGPGGIALQNEIGQPFRRTIDATWLAATPISLSCSVPPRWHDWTGHVGEPSSSNGVLVMRLGGRDMLPVSLVCDDMVDPALGAKPYLPLESRYEGSCTPRW